LKLLRDQITKAQKDSQVTNVFLHFWDLRAQKMLGNPPKLCSPRFRIFAVKLECCNIRKNPLTIKMAKFNSKKIKELCIIKEKSMVD